MSRTRGGPAKMKRWLKRKILVDSPSKARDLHRKVHIQVGDELIPDTPVGNPDLWASPPPKNYSGGRAKGNWQSSTGSPKSGETGVIDPRGSATLAANRAVGNSIPVGSVSYVVNNAPYIVRLNQTPQHSRQQTPHWIERGLQRVREQFV